MLAEEYLQEFDVQDKIKAAICAVLRDRPADPIAGIVDYLKVDAVPATSDAMDVTASQITHAGTGVSAAADIKEACAAAVAAAKVAKPTMAFCACASGTLIERPPRTWTRAIPRSA